MFVNDENLPDVLVCMDEVVTECVYQALIDYNQVGNVKEMCIRDRYDGDGKFICSCNLYDPDISSL